METVKILQVVGFKNSGKTTLILQLLKMAEQLGKSVAVIKHHGHGGALGMPPADTDSTRFFAAGAESSVAFGGGVIQLHMRKPLVSVEELLTLAQMHEPDLVLIEGYKDAKYDKIVLLRSEEDWTDLQKLDNIVLVIGQETTRLKTRGFIERTNTDQLTSWFADWLEGGTDESI
ncbi:molybdopterin-guanine dinucleotide biosynthesis protein B [Planococcus lenghuensis]|uniref:Molybdopterin-guanine dinucleotide biosynthesis protein B n=1 Tax=Planococcus lenghuensis TaxID=2213202 RepID=A0A1Q2KUZ8_9BACL|nr:molybdopterin-guanine dinucleotide biosynthesis protein B [Planococcus lenghuensis]AQQ51944.1 molybdopterin-guanine dinucleotide biosynthesis protein B [Planococcus lenghuensis]